MEHQALPKEAMTDTELATLAVRLRQLMDEWGPEAARAAFAKQAAALDPQARDSQV
jgi:predicted DNA-binding transcriptional regulator YafY